MKRVVSFPCDFLPMAVGEKRDTPSTQERIKKERNEYICLQPLTTRWSTNQRFWQLSEHGLVL